MKNHGLRRILFIGAVLVLFTVSSAIAQETKPRPIELKDILAWKSIRGNALSDNGEWFAYQLGPGEGDAEAILRHTKTDRETRFPIGELPRERPSRGEAPERPTSRIAFSADSQWLAFLVYPSQKEAERLKRQRRPVQTKLALVGTAAGTKTEYEKVRSFSFSGENPGWIAYQKYGPDSAARSKVTGTDMILQELATGKQINIGNVSDFAFDKKGRWLAWTIDAADMSGNGLQVRDMKSGAVTPLDSDKAVYKRLSWTREGGTLAVLKGKEDKKYENETYSLVAFARLGDPAPLKVSYQPAEDSAFPSEMTISPNRSPQWTESLDGIYFGIHALKKKDEKEPGAAERPEGAEPPAGGPGGEAAREENENKPDLVLWHWLDQRLQAQQQVEENRDKNFSYLCFFNVPEKKFVRLADDEIRQVSADPEHRFAIGLDNREYERMGSLDGRRYQDIYAVDPRTGSRKLAVKKCRWYFGASPQGDSFLYYDDGHFLAYDMLSGQARNITKGVATSFIDTEDDHNVVNPPVRPVGWAKDGKSVLLYDNWDVWQVPAAAGAASNLTVNGRKDGLRYRRRLVLDREERGIDLAGAVYFDVLAEKSKESGIARIDGGRPGAAMLLWDDALHASLQKADDAGVYLYTVETYGKYPDFYVADASLRNGRRITDANPQQKDFLWSSGSKLIDYTSDKGDRLQAALFLPAGYETGKSYPAVVYIYEKLTSGFNRYYAPTANGFNKSVYTSNGYAVLMPDIVYKVDDPGMSAVWCVVPAVKAAVATGVVDPARVAIHGHSWGGYQTAFLITQTDIFRAAIAGAALTNMISMYSSVYWNTGSANQPIFESSQGRFRGGPWEVPEAYTRNSPVYYAQNIKTPLLLLHNDKDGAVDWNQGVTYYNTVRRMQKPVVMLQYAGENHGLVKPANQKDYTVRMKEFLDHHLMGKPAPKWWLEGVPWLELDEELESRAEKPPSPEPKKKPESP